MFTKAINFNAWPMKLNIHAIPTAGLKLIRMSFFGLPIFVLVTGNRQKIWCRKHFLSALGSLTKFRFDCSEKTWLYNILKNKIIDYYRKQDHSPVRKSDSRAEESDEQFLQHFFNHEGSGQKHWNSASRTNRMGITR